MLEIFAGRAAVLYVLKTLYVRVLEDRRLFPTIRIREGGTYPLFRRLFPQLHFAAYLRTVFVEAERLLPSLFARTPIEIVEPGETAASAVWTVWQETAADGAPRFDFRDAHDTRFISASQASRAISANSMSLRAAAGGDSSSCACRAITHANIRD